MWQQMEAYCERWRVKLIGIIFGQVNDNIGSIMNKLGEQRFLALLGSFGY
jgi:hypothetical protein